MHRIPLRTVVVLLVLAAASCGGGGGGGTTTPAFDLTGYWQLFATPTGAPEVGPIASYFMLTGNTLDGVALTGTASGSSVAFQADGGAFQLTATGTATSANSVNGALTLSGGLSGNGTFRLERFVPTGMLSASGTLDGNAVALTSTTAIGARNFSDQALTNQTAVALIATDAVTDFEIELSPMGLVVGTLSVPGDITADVLLRTDTAIVDATVSSGTVVVSSYDMNGIAGMYTLTTSVGTVTGMFMVDFDFDRYDP